MFFDDLRTDLAEIETSLSQYPRGSDVPQDQMERRNAAQRQVDDIIYPVLTLPSEITSEIFIKCVESVGEDFASHSCAPLLLLQVCRLWRLIALATPSLWNRLILTASGSMAKGQWYNRPESPADNWLRPPNLHQRPSGKGGDTNCLDILLHRHARSLQHLLLLIDWDYPAYPAIQSGAISRILALSWDQLSTLTATHLAIADCLRVLQACPRLQKCDLTTMEGDLPPGPMLVHGALEELFLFHAAGQLVARLELPALRGLCLEGCISSGAHFLPFLARSAASLRQFSFRSYFAEDTDGLSLAWFRTMVNLTSVELYDVVDSVTRPFLLALNRNTDSEFLPHLRSLQIVAMTHTVDAPVVEALWSRYTKSDAVKLEILRLVCFSYDPIHWQDVGEVDWDSLCDLGESGMDIHVGSREDNFLWEWD
ncbi:hypothetical protein FB451DRAFT_773383 [Mycena latifolia]|nr:hypothetical protein FB451DRAFT_773383 [Mycena latifolia]